MANYYKAALTFNNNNLGKAVNVFYLEDASGIASDSVVLEQMGDYLEAVYAPIRSAMDTGYIVMDCPVYEVTATGDTVRTVGTIEPACTGTSASEGLPLVDAASMMARTNIPRVQGRKRLGGLVEGATANGLILNGILTVLAQAAAIYILGLTGWPELNFHPGVPSSKSGSFERFSGTGTVTNIPGTQITRKPGRGA